jgi:hypothetical protein
VSRIQAAKGTPIGALRPPRSQSHSGNAGPALGRDLNGTTAGLANPPDRWCGLSAPDVTWLFDRSEALGFILCDDHRRKSDYNRAGEQRFATACSAATRSLAASERR